jgi:hypothetical protein
MLTDSYLIPALFLFTFAVAIAVGIYQYNKAKKARANNLQSAQGKAQGERPGERHIDEAGAAKTAATDDQDQRPHALRS